MRHSKVNKYNYEVIYNFSKFFNTLWRIAFIMPAMLGILYYILNYKVNSPFPLWIVILASFSIILLVLLIRFVGHKEIKASDIYHFYITDTKVVSKHPLGSEHRLSYEINISKIVKLVSFLGNDEPRHTAFKIKIAGGKTYELSGNYVNPEKVFKVIKSLRPELQISRSRD